jgi:nucleoside-diphosphate-sugar epimerase
LGRGYSVVALDNFCSGSWENLHGLHGRDGFEVVEGDVRDRSVVRKDLKVVYGKPRKGDIRNNYGDPSKAEKTLGFKSKTSLKEGLEKMMSHFGGFARALVFGDDRNEKCL